MEILAAAFGILFVVLVVGLLLVGGNKPVVFFPPQVAIVLGSVAAGIPWLKVPKMVLTPDQQKHHGFLIGITGSGKSKLLQSLFTQHLAKGHGVGLIDPHHDLARDIIAQLVQEGFFKDPRAYQRLVYIDWGSGYVTPANLLRPTDTSYAPDEIDDAPHTLAKQMLDVAYRVYPELAEGAAQFTETYLAGVLTLISNQLPLTYLYKLLNDADFRSACMAAVKDPLILDTLHNFDTLLPRDQDSKAGSAMRRAFDLTFHPILRLSLGQPDSVLQHRKWMDEGVCVIHDLGKVRDVLTRRLLGALLMVDIEQAAMSRASQPFLKRRPFTLLCDEWASFAAQGATIGHILSETRKWGMRIYLSGQSTSQIPNERLAGALENCKIQIAFSLGRESAVKQSLQIAPVDVSLIKEAGLTETQHAQYFSVIEQFESWCQQLQNLPPRHAYVKLHDEHPIKIKTRDVPQDEADPQEVAQVLATYRSLYQRSAPDAEAQIATIPLPKTTEHPAEHSNAVPAYLRAHKKQIKELVN